MLARLIRTLVRFRPRDWLLLTAAYWWQLRGWFLLRRLRGPGWLDARQGSLRQLPHRADRPDHWVAERVRFIDIAGRYPFRWSLCLQSSIALHDWLAHGGVYPDLRIGARRDGDRLAGHAWVELGGRVLNDGPHVEARFPALKRAVPPSER